MKPRDFALRELDGRRLPGWRAGTITKGASHPPADPRDLALAEHIVVGVTKNLLLLQHLIQHYSGRSLKSIDPAVQKILAIALYQLRFLDRIPASAAVDEAVEQTRRFGQRRASGFVNAVLRKATRESLPELPSHDSPAEYARIVLSHPPELFGKLEDLLGAEDALHFCAHDQIEPPTIVRLAHGRDASELGGDGITVVAHERPGMYVVKGAKRSHLADWAGRRVAQVQDPTAGAVVAHLDVKPGDVVLDRCCGLGTKTIQLHEAVGPDGRVIAVDPASARCEGLRRLLEQRAIKNVSVYCAAWMNDLPPDAPREFDRVLIDAPCSNSGVLARRPEARYAQTSQSLRSLMNLQDQILCDSAPSVKPGGMLVYSTCSVWPEENGARVDVFVQQHSDFEPLEERNTLPSFDSDPARYRDGGYWAALRRK
ncbi:MAG TPA: transcription antitermination factor NusB [Tepidisphaeraceae bacterium]|jgi:16S rRNA (cytosine967-C5)-methyltransferase